MHMIFRTRNLVLLLGLLVTILLLFLYLRMVTQKEDQNVDRENDVTFTASGKDAYFLAPHTKDQKEVERQQFIARIKQSLKEDTPVVHETIPSADVNEVETSEEVLTTPEVVSIFSTTTIHEEVATTSELENIATGTTSVQDFSKTLEVI